MIKNVHLGFFISEYDKEPIWLDLMTFKDAMELDRFMDYFYNNNEKVRELFDQDIGEYAIDNIDQFRKVEKVRGNNFRGRLSAYYYNDYGKIEFLELPTPRKKPVRDYRMISSYEKCVTYLSRLFDEAVKRINDKHKNSRYGPAKGEFVHYICEKFRQCSYEFSENEVYYLVVYYNNPNEKNRKTCLNLMKANVKSYYDREKERLAKEHMEDLIAERLTPPEEELACTDGASEKLQEDIERAKRTGDYEQLFANYGIEEIEKYTNVLKKGRK